MHKKPIYSFEDKNSTTIDQVPLLSIMHIEDTTDLGAVDDRFIDLNKGPALIIIIGKTGVGTATKISQFIAMTNNWMWFYNGDYESRFKDFVLKAGDTMTGHLNVPSGAAGTQVPQIKAVVKKTGDTMSGILNMGGKRVENIGAPNSNDDAMRRDTYATSTSGGTIKARRSGNVLYMTTNGANA